MSPVCPPPTPLSEIAPGGDNLIYFYLSQSKDLRLIWKVFESTFQKEFGCCGNPILTTTVEKAKKNEQ